MKKITKVRINYEDGSSIEVSGSEAEKWQNMVDSMSALAYAHGYNYPELKWEQGSPPLHFPMVPTQNNS